MTAYSVFIPRWHPTRLNLLLGNRWKAARLKRSDRKIVTWYCRIAKIPHATGKRRVTLTIILKPAQRAADADAYFKSGIDALVHAGMLADDNRQHVELMPVRFERSAEWGTKITLEDMEAGNAPAPIPS